MNNQFILDQTQLKSICSTVYIQSKYADARFDDIINHIIKEYDKYSVQLTQKRIDRVTTNRLDIALRMCGYELDYQLIDNIIDLVELIEDKGDEVSIKDVQNLQSLWKNI